MKVNVFTPFENSSNVYSFAYTINGQLKRFGINRYGKMQFSYYDRFTFEFAGYLDASRTVKSWRIRRTDGQYLTAGLKYAQRLFGASEAQQIFLFSSLGNNQYNILLPKLDVCNLVEYE
jgi:hypothetical protein